MTRSKRILFSLLFSFVGLASCTSSGPGGGSDDDSDDCPRGTEGCSCDDGACDGRLRCLSNLCVDDAANGGSVATGGAGPTGGRGGTSGSSGVATGGTGVTGGASGAAGAAGLNSGSGGTSVDGAPIFLTFSANTMLLEYEQTLTVTAVLTDPDGIDDLIGGTLLDPDTSGTYGSFSVAAAEGSYSLSLTWEQLKTTRTIEAEPLGVARSFRAQFFDAAGHMATRDLGITLRCNQPGTQAYYGCCAGEIADLNSSQYPLSSCSTSCGGCGACGRHCDAPPTWADSSTTSLVVGSSSWCGDFRCVSSGSTSSSMSCQAYCASVGATCVEPSQYTRDTRNGLITYAGLGRYSGSSSVRLTSCAMVPPPTSTSGGTFMSVSCFCSDETPPAWVAELP